MTTTLGGTEMSNAAGTFRELLGPGRIATSVVLAGGVALQAINLVAQFLHLRILRESGRRGSHDEGESKRGDGAGGQHKKLSREKGYRHRPSPSHLIRFEHGPFYLNFRKSARTVNKTPALGRRGRFEQ
jgi:hypothetical protein